MWQTSEIRLRHLKVQDIVCESGSWTGEKTVVRCSGRQVSRITALATFQVTIFHTCFILLLKSGFEFLSACLTQRLASPPSSRQLSTLHPPHSAVNSGPARQTQSHHPHVHPHDYDSASPCWNKQGPPWKRHCLLGSVRCSKSCIYRSALKVPSQMCR